MHKPWSDLVKEFTDQIDCSFNHREVVDGMESLGCESSIKLFGLCMTIQCFLGTMCYRSEVAIQLLSVIDILTATLTRDLKHFDSVSGSQGCVFIFCLLNDIVVPDTMTQQGCLICCQMSLEFDLAKGLKQAEQALI